jgi:two-component system sensor histidine kinase KdpD
LRELALQHVTKAVDRTLTDYLDRKHIKDNWPVCERVAVCISSNPASRQLIARGARLVEAIGGQLYVLHVDTERDRTEEQQRSLATNIRFAENLKGEVVHVKGKNIASAVAAFVREKRITQVIFGRSAVKGIRKYLYYSAVQRFLKEVPSVDVHIVTQGGERE